MSDFKNKMEDLICQKSDKLQENEEELLMLYIVVCYSVHNKEIASYDVFKSESDAYAFLEKDAQNTYEEEYNNSNDKEKEQIDFTISDDGTAYLSSCNREFEWTWEVITVQ